MRKQLILLLPVLVAGCLLAGCGAPSAAQQFGNANAKLATSWSRYFNGTSGEEGLTALGWVEGQSAVTIKHVNQWLSRSSHLAAAIAQYDATLGPLAAKTPYRSDVDALIIAGSKLIADLKNPADQGGQPVCSTLGCLNTPLQDGNPWSTEWLTARQDETTVYADFGIANTAGGPYAPAQ